MLRRSVKLSFPALILLFVVIQVVRPSRDNPRVDPARDVAAVHLTPPTVSAILQRSCNDCHSNQTNWPWYSNVAPFSWVVAHDVKDGRKALNLSEWAAYPGEERQKLAGEMCEAAKEREMPLTQYTLVHRRARLSGPDTQVLCSWTQQLAPQAAEAREEVSDDAD